VLSLVSWMSNTGAFRSGQPSPRLYPVLLRNPPRDRDGYVEHAVWVFSRIGSPGFERDDEDLRRLARLSYDRGINPAGNLRQLAAIIASGDRTRLLRTITAPTLVIHGTEDRLVPPSGGRATARAIPGARLLRIEGMGHDLPRAAWPRVLDAIEENAARAGAPAAVR
jgi:pimeloyl-ACP methyl ester carboxylesterase